MEERLHYLFNRYLKNECSHEELEEFFQYIERAKQDTQLRQLIRDVYNELDDSTHRGPFVDATGKLILQEPAFNQPAVQSVSVRNTRRKVKMVLIAMVCVIIAGIGWKVQQNPVDVPISSSTLKSTNRSEYKLLLLKDSTQVWLNAASTLEFPDEFDSRKREVFLKGEAFFDVKHADKIPFIIHTGDISTTVLGTAFNIKAYPGQENITISVSRGKVRVSDRKGWTTMLNKGEQVKVASAGKEAVAKSIHVEEVAAWQQGSLSFDDESLRDIIADMERVYNVSIRLGKPSLEGLKISTSFKREIGIEQALQVLSKLTDTGLTTENGIYIIQ